LVVGAMDDQPAIEQAGGGVIRSPGCRIPVAGPASPHSTIKGRSICPADLPRVLLK
jgi:hypothetical protein